MWFVAYQTAPVGYEISFSRALVATILMGISDYVSKTILVPLIGDWRLLAYSMICIVIVMVILRLKFWRSLLAVSVYFASWIVFFFVLGCLAKRS